VTTEARTSAAAPGGAPQATMRAARYTKATNALALEDVPVPEPGPGEALVKVAFCGICLTDVHIVSGRLMPPLPVVTPGHESAGTIASLGHDVPETWAVGDRVAVYSARRDGVCAACIRGGDAEQCLNLQVMGSDYDGAWAEFVVVPHTALVAVPESVPLEQAAIMADAVGTPYAALTDSAALRPGESVGVWGAGGLGVHAIQLARAMGALPIVAVDNLDAARARAPEFGADAALDPRAPDFAERVADLTDHRGLDVALDFVGAPPTVSQAVASLTRLGRLVIIGAGTAPLELPSSRELVRRQPVIRGHLGYFSRHLRALVALVHSGRLDLSRSISELLALDDVAEGVKRLDQKVGDPIRLVIRM
jgi:2-desacetyl-2-hydroxyethyl bacteriochlorophyllide A dehydrogenase